MLVGLRDGLRSGDVFVRGSRRYADPASFLLTPEAWAPVKLEFCHLVGKPAQAADALAQADDELHHALDALRGQDYPVLDPDAARLSAYQYKHINVHGHYSFALPDLGGGRRPLRDPDTVEE